MTCPSSNPRVFGFNAFAPPTSLHSMPDVCFNLSPTLLMPTLFHSLTKQTQLQASLWVVSLYQKDIFQLSPAILSPMWTKDSENRNIRFSSGSTLSRSVMPHKVFFSYRSQQIFRDHSQAVYTATGHWMLAFVLFEFKLRKQLKIDISLSYLGKKIIQQITLVDNVQYDE